MGFESGLSARDRSIRMRLAFIFGFFFLAVGVYMFSVFMPHNLETIDSYKWPSVRGKITASEVAEKMDQCLYSYGRRTTHLCKMYYLKVHYAYSVRGVNYIGDRVSFVSRLASTPERIRSGVNDYFIGKDVQVFCQPQNPRNCVLDLKDNLIAMLLGFSFTLVFSGFFFLLAYFLFRDFQKVKNARDVDGEYFIK